MSLDGLFVGNNGIVAGIRSRLLCCSIMTGDCASNCLLILLDNEVTTLYPFLQQDGTCRLSGCCAVQIPTTMATKSRSAMFLTRNPLRLEWISCATSFALSKARLVARKSRS